MLKRVQIDVTERCNLKCKHCRASIQPKDELPTKHLVALLKELNNLKVKTITFSGGEPLLRKDIYKLIKKAKSMRFFVTMTTNGTLINEKNIQKLKASNIDRVQVSLDGASAMTHDNFRGIEGAFDKTINGIKKLKANNIDVALRTTVSILNYKEIEKIVQLAIDLQVSKLELREVIPVGRGKKIWKKIALPTKKYIELVQKFLDYKNINVTCGDPITIPHNSKLLNKLMSLGNIFNGTLLSGCLVGRSVLYINACGDVFPCSYLPIFLGNIREKKLEEIIKSSETLNLLKNYKNHLKGRCRNCKFKYICGGCRAVALSLTGDLLGEDTRCFLSG